MNVTQTSRRAKGKRAYQSPLRVEQATSTRRKIQDALFQLFDECGSDDEITFKAVARRAHVTEMTVYRHFPTRVELLNSLWERMNEEIGPQIKMPTTADELIQTNPALHRGFDRIPKQMVASITTRQGRELRASKNAERQQAFVGIVRQLNPRLSQARSRQMAAIVQLMHSAYAWDSLRESWGFTGEEIAQATQLGIEQLIRGIQHLEGGKSS